MRADKEAIAENNKDSTKGSGIFFPLTAAQKFAMASPTTTGSLANAVYLPHVAALQFTGDYTMTGV